MKEIKVIIGSPSTDLELAHERDKLMSFIQGLNNQFGERGIFIEGYICDETPCSMRTGGLQEQHNDYISNNTDASIFMFFNKAGVFMLDELKLARDAFLQKKRPNVYVLVHCRFATWQCRAFYQERKGIS